MPSESRPVPERTGSPFLPPTVHHGRKHPASATAAPRAARTRDRPIGRRCMVMAGSGESRLRVALRTEHAHEPEVAVQLAVVEPIADDELIRDREADVVDVDLD